MTTNEVWMTVLFRHQEAKACFCGKPKGHDGWLQCARLEAERLDGLR